MKPEVMNKKQCYFIDIKRAQGIAFKVQQTADPAQRNKVKIILFSNKEYNENFRVMCS